MADSPVPRPVLIESLCFPHFVLYLLRGILRNPRCQRLRAAVPSMCFCSTNLSATLHNLIPPGIILQ